ncbi:MAG: electron transport complex subunit RsxA [Bacteroidaceae bacterium]|nr:electron transport complex subunit RsxA [Paraprevotella sp.]MDY2716207.1 electron transport complex subunit RsxA [Bacteroidaceae bacterium]MCI6743546.1 electron transport complex subunit RsxA [Paraprevotella sp.]MDD6606996.1 electron transport complex subunit RsxA [Paraprevotella sp.]MDD7099173.1 electron transport complex subunit RsxA [Paraprevotella sp.]
MAYILIFITAIFVNNVVLSQFLGICPFLGVSKKVDSALGMGAAVAFVLTLATIVTYLVQKFVLVPFSLEYLQTIAFILVIAALVQMVEIILKKTAPALYQALGVFLPLITTNCCILGVAILVANGNYATQGLEPDLLTGVVYAFSTAVGFALALVVFAAIREQLDLMPIPMGMRGMSIALVTAGLLAMAFMGFSGVDAGLARLFGIGQ